MNWQSISRLVWEVGSSQSVGTDCFFQCSGEQNLDILHLSWKCDVIHSIVERMYLNRVFLLLLLHNWNLTEWIYYNRPGISDGISLRALWNDLTQYGTSKPNQCIVSKRMEERIIGIFMSVRNRKLLHYIMIVKISSSLHPAYIYQFGANRTAYLRCATVCVEFVLILPVFFGRPILVNNYVGPYSSNKIINAKSRHSFYVALPFVHYHARTVKTQTKTW